MRTRLLLKFSVEFSLLGKLAMLGAIASCRLRGLGLEAARSRQQQPGEANEQPRRASRARAFILGEARVSEETRKRDWFYVMPAGHASHIMQA